GRAEISATGVTEIAADEGLVLRSGQSEIRLSPGGVSIAAPAISLAAGVSTVSLSGDGNVRIDALEAIIRAALLVIEAAGSSVSRGTEVQIDGAKLLLNSPSSASDPVVVDRPPPTKIELRDRQGRPIPNQRYVLTLDDGSERSGFLDGQGRAEIDVEAAGSI